MRGAQAIERRAGQIAGDQAAVHRRNAVTLGPMDLELLDRRLAERAEPAFRARQVWEWTARGAASYEEMSNLPGSLRGALDAEVPFSSLALERTARSRDGTEKALFATADGRPVEAVLMRYRDGRRSLCLSSQSGCPLTCSFCATGSMRFGRNLSASEILDQALQFRRAEAVDHAVFMGMGEPLMNLDSVLAACERLPDLGIAASRTTISTVGWIPGIERLAREGPRVRLALSVHAPDEALRSELMPVNDRYRLADVLDACRAWREARRRRVYVEYLMLAGVNDRPEQARALASLLRPRHAFKVNLIPYNPTGGEYSGSGRGAIEAFRATLAERGVPATLRLTRGRDIDAACGQLAAAGRAPGFG
ncbi:MAG: 23S rRNA (adenine(2503)-C(2))-methyltransferase RlmN [Solirubrobacterales bacterium]|nr:23S rRNA (adenine(2503)-C(2))-methyltransferase RlmN [Solirubrobacterales bacterium]